MEKIKVDQNVVAVRESLNLYETVCYGNAIPFSIVKTHNDFKKVLKDDFVKAVDDNDNKNLIEVNKKIETGIIDTLSNTLNLYQSWAFEEKNFFEQIKERLNKFGFINQDESLTNQINGLYTIYEYLNDFKIKNKGIEITINTYIIKINEIFEKTKKLIGENILLDPPQNYLKERNYILRLYPDLLECLMEIHFNKDIKKRTENILKFSALTRTITLDIGVNDHYVFSINKQYYKFLFDVAELKEQKQQILDSLKSRSKLLISNRYDPKDGQFKEVIQGEEFNFRLAVTKGLMQQIHNKQLTEVEADLAYLGITPSLQNYPELNYTERSEKRINEILKKKNLAIFVSGAMGVGKSTLCRKMLEKLSDTNQVITCEDPVEQTIMKVRHVPVKKEIGNDFNALKLFFARSRSNVFFYGEIRNSDEAQSLKSWTIFDIYLATIHSNNAIDGIFQTMEGYKISRAELGNIPFVSIHLNRFIVNCQSCLDEYPVDENLKQKISTELKIPMNLIPSSHWKSRGCNDCKNLGYADLVAPVLEDFEWSPESKEMLELLSNYDWVRSLREKVVNSSIYTPAYLDILEHIKNKHINWEDVLAQCNTVKSDQQKENSTKQSAKTDSAKDRTSQEETKDFSKAYNSNSQSNSDKGKDDKKENSNEYKEKTNNGPFTSSIQSSKEIVEIELNPDDISRYDAYDMEIIPLDNGSNTEIIDKNEIPLTNNPGNKELITRDNKKEVSPSYTQNEVEELIINGVDIFNKFKEIDLTVEDFLDTTSISEDLNYLSLENNLKKLIKKFQEEIKKNKKQDSYIDILKMKLRDFIDLLYEAFAAKNTEQIVNKSNKVQNHTIKKLQNVKEIKKDSFVIEFNDGTDITMTIDEAYLAYNKIIRNIGKSDKNFDAIQFKQDIWNKYITHGNGINLKVSFENDGSYKVNTIDELYNEEIKKIKGLDVKYNTNNDILISYSDIISSMRNCENNKTISILWGLWSECNKSSTYKEFIESLCRRFLYYNEVGTGKVPVNIKIEDKNNISFIFSKSKSSKTDIKTIDDIKIKEEKEGPFWKEDLDLSKLNEKTETELIERISTIYKKWIDELGGYSHYVDYIGMFVQDLKTKLNNQGRGARFDKPLNTIVFYKNKNKISITLEYKEKDKNSNLY